MATSIKSHVHHQFSSRLPTISLVYKGSAEIQGRSRLVRTSCFVAWTYLPVHNPDDADGRYGESLTRNGPELSVKGSRL